MKPLKSKILFLNNFCKKPHPIQKLKTSTGKEVYPTINGIHRHTHPTMPE